MPTTRVPSTTTDAPLSKRKGVASTDWNTARTSASGTTNASNDGVGAAFATPNYTFYQSVYAFDTSVLAGRTINSVHLEIDGTYAQTGTLTAYVNGDSWLPSTSMASTTTFGTSGVGSGDLLSNEPSAGVFSNGPTGSVNTAGLTTLTIATTDQAANTTSPGTTARSFRYPSTAYLVVDYTGSPITWPAVASVVLSSTTAGTTWNYGPNYTYSVFDNFDDRSVGAAWDSSKWTTSVGTGGTQTMTAEVPATLSGTRVGRFSCSGTPTATYGRSVEVGSPGNRKIAAVKWGRVSGATANNSRFHLSIGDGTWSASDPTMTANGYVVRQVGLNCTLWKVVAGTPTQIGSSLSAWNGSGAGSGITMAISGTGTITVTTYPIGHNAETDHGGQRTVNTFTDSTYLSGGTVQIGVAPITATALLVAEFDYIQFGAVAGFNLLADGASAAITSSVTAASTLDRSASSSVTMPTSVAAAADLYRLAVASLGTSAAVTAQARSDRFLAAAILAGSSLDGSAARALDATASMACVVAVDGQAAFLHSVAAALALSCAPAGTYDVIRLAAGQLLAELSVAVEAMAERAAQGDLSTAAELAADGIADRWAVVDLSAAAELAGEALRELLFGALIESYGWLHEEVVVGLRSGTQPHSHVEVS